MNCKEFREQTGLWLDDELSEEDSKKCEEHKNNCKECAAYVDDIIHIEKALKALPIEPLPENFEKELRKRLKHVNKTRKTISFRKWSRYGVAAAAGFFVAAFVFSQGPLFESGYKEVYEEAYENDSNSIEKPKIQSFEMTSEAPEVKKEERSVLAGKANYESDVALESKMESNGSDTGSPRQANFDDSTQKKLEVKEDVPAGRILIQSASLNLDVTDYEKAYSFIEKSVKGWGGFIGDANTFEKEEWKDVDGPALKQGSLVVRVPQNTFGQALETFKNLGKQTHLSVHSEDVTPQYRDTADEVENLQVREKKLREIMNTANTVEDTIVVERELSQVRAKINKYKKQLKTWERLSELSQIEIRLNEVKRLTPRIEPIDKSLGKRIQNGFIDSLNHMRLKFENGLVHLVEVLPLLFFWIIVALIGWRVGLRIYKKIISKLGG